MAKECCCADSRVTCYSRYVGIDLSASAISVAQEAANERSTFLAADCENYSPEEHFDVIVFNEVLCCLRDPLRTVERYARSLNPGGLLFWCPCARPRGAVPQYCGDSGERMPPSMRFG